MEKKDFELHKLATCLMCDIEDYNSTEKSYKNSLEMIKDCKEDNEIDDCRYCDKYIGCMKYHAYYSLRKQFYDTQKQLCERVIKNRIQILKTLEK